MPIVLLILFAPFLPWIIRHNRMKHYFSSPTFLEHKVQVATLVQELNEISEYIDEIRASGSFEIGASSSGRNAKFASFENTSVHNYRRDRNVANYTARNVHNTSLQVVRNASANPIKYLMKYFSISSDEETLVEVENVGESISRLENAIANLRKREASISKEISPPKFILKHYLARFRAEIGITIPQLNVPYPRYVFQYVSAGGNSSQISEVVLTSSVIDTLIEEISSKIRIRKSAKGQRALMTARFREIIKVRDDYTCQICEISVQDEPHLLLEVDHIKPLSKGGTSVASNLQTLCWKCNRTKSNKY